MFLRLAAATVKREQTFPSFLPLLQPLTLHHTSVSPKHYDFDRSSAAAKRASGNTAKTLHKSEDGELLKF